MKSLNHQFCALRKKLNMETAIVSNIVNDNYTIMELDTDIPAFKVGDVFEVNNTYCSAVVNSGETIVYNNVSTMEEMQLHPVYVMMQLLSYIGTPIYKNGQFWGTLNFSSSSARQDDFTYEEIKSVETLAQRYSDILS